MRTALAALVAVLVLASPASGYWRTAGTGSGNAGTDTLAAGTQPSVSASGRAVTVSWAQTSFHGGLLGSFGGGYQIKRYPSAGGTAVTPNASCATAQTGTAATLTCTEANVPLGLWRYTVSPQLASSWTGAESPASAAASVVPDAPVLTATSSAGGAIAVSWTAPADAASYKLYRRVGSGTFTLLASPTGTTYSDSATTNGTTYGYVVRAVAPAATGGTVESADSAEDTAVADSAGPTVTLTNPGSPLRGTVSFASTSSDAGTGVASVRYQYAPTGTSTWYDICTGTMSPFSCSVDSSLGPDGVYDLRAIATDNAGNTSTSASVTGRRIDNTAPAASLTAPATYLKGTVLLSYTASDAGSGLTSVKVQRAPTGTSTWTDICSSGAAASPCSFNTTAIADGVYDLRVLVVDAAGNSSTSGATGVTVDNTKPIGTNVQTANKVGGTAGRPEQGDSITFTTSEPLAPASVLTGWTGAATSVTVRISAAASGVLQVYNSGNTAILPLGNVTLGKKYATLALTFTASSMVMSGSTITVTLGTQQIGGAAATGTGTGTLSWATVATPTDLAGNVMTAGTVTEGGTADLDF